MVAVKGMIWMLCWRQCIAIGRVIAAEGEVRLVYL